jgi:hypothetical protein
VLVDGVHRLPHQVPLLRQDDGGQAPPQRVGVADGGEGGAVPDGLNWDWLWVDGRLGS